LPGLDELMALFEIASWVETRQYDCIVVDTAPSGHTLRLLAMPELIGALAGHAGGAAGQAPVYAAGL